jgi:hypothetical protein
MDQRERTGNLEESLRAAINGFLVNLWTALPGIVVSFDAVKMTCVVQPAIKAYVRGSDGTQTWKQLPQLLDVPVVFPCAGGFAFTLPIVAGDEVLVIFASRCMDAWWQNGGVQVQAEFRLHDLSDGFAIPGPQSQPKTLPAISTTNAQLRTRAGTAYIELTPAGVVNIVAPGGVNITGNLNVDGNTELLGGIDLDGGVDIGGDLTVEGQVTATGEGTFNGGHTVSAHKHGGVQPGSGTTALPTG